MGELNGQPQFEAGEGFDNPAQEVLTIEMLEQYRINPEVIPPHPDIALKMNGQNICTLGSFSLLYGKPKARKSFFSALIAAAGLNSTTGFDPEKTGITGHLPDNKKEIIVLDTEQGGHFAGRYANRIHRIAQKSDKLHFFSLRKCTTAQRFEFIEKALQAHPNTGMILIDGIRDMVRSINDEEETSRVIDLLLRVTEQYQIHIMNVLHMNKATNFARGVIGSEIQNKAECTIALEVDQNDKNITIATPEYCRDIDPGPVAFFINEHGLPEVIPDWKPPAKDTKKARLAPQAIAPDQHKNIINKVAEKNTHFKGYEDCWRTIKNVMSDILGDTISRDTAIDYLKHYELEGYIEVKKQRGKKNEYIINTTT